MTKKFKEITGQDFNTIYKEYYPALVNYLKKYKIQQIDAEILANEGFMKSLMKIDYFNPKYKLKTWIYSVTKRLALQYKIDRKKIISFDPTEKSEDKLSIYIRYNNEQDDYADVLEYEERVQERYKIALTEISKLEYKYRRFIELYNIEGKSYKEIIEITGANMQTVKNRLFYGRAKLSKILDNY